MLFEQHSTQTHAKSQKATNRISRYYLFKIMEWYDCVLEIHARFMISLVKNVEITNTLIT